MSKKSALIKGLAVGAVLAAVAKAVMVIKEDDKKSKELAKIAKRIKERVVGHTKSIGKLSKASYAKIVDTVMAEYRTVKDLSGSENSEIRKELKNDWSAIKKMFKK
ncbi:hypothetical protein HY633_04925 [Candidatus Uhrbacteria bacterium]|nr:hypothetical protein [Candidatus Uhrbacteria bacterium]